MIKPKFKVGELVIVKTVKELEKNNQWTAKDIKNIGSDWRDSCGKILRVTDQTFYNGKYEYRLATVIHWVFPKNELTSLIKLKLKMLG